MLFHVIFSQSMAGILRAQTLTKKFGQFSLRVNDFGTLCMSPVSVNSVAENKCSVQSLL